MNIAQSVMKKDGASQQRFGRGWVWQHRGGAGSGRTLLLWAFVARGNFTAGGNGAVGGGAGGARPVRATEDLLCVAVSCRAAPQHSFGVQRWRKLEVVVQALKVSNL